MLIITKRKLASVAAVSFFQKGQSDIIPNYNNPLQMRPKSSLKFLLFSLVIAGICAPVWAAKFIEARPVDDEYVMVYWQDSAVEYKDDGKGDTAFKGPENDTRDMIKTYGQALDISTASNAASYTLTSKDDANYSTAIKPTTAFRKTKVSGVAFKWPEGLYALEHTVFLKLPKKLQQDKHYTLSIAANTNSDVISKDFSFDIFKCVSEAIHVNIIGYNPDHTVMKSGDLYMWMGDGGARDYSSYVGKKSSLVNVSTGEKQPVGTVSFWKPSGSDFGGWNLTRSNVWNCDFSSFTGTGTYRLAIEGVGCSPDFQIKKDAYYEPFKTSVRGFFYMRIGESKDIAPVPRQPRYIPGKDPANFKVYMTSYGPWHPDWKKKGGDQWDNRDWSKYKEPGEPTNPNAWGGHADAADWDRNPAHILIIYDLLLPYILSNGRINDDNLQIPESGNGLADIIDEARYEVEFWLRLRDSKGGYCAGLNNPDEKNNCMYQAVAKPYMAWANAANCAMLADCYRIAGKTDLMNKYKDAAVEAWKVANDEDLDVKYDFSDGVMRGRDLKMMTGAFLYNVTGDKAYEDAMVKESLATTPATELDKKGNYCQYWGTAAYLMCAKQGWRQIHYPTLLNNMKSSIINEAMQKNVDESHKRPSRRSSDNAYGWFQSVQQVQALCIAHTVATNQSDRDSMLKALLLEADYGLGRNPMNMVQMTGLGSRCVEDIYTSGRNDGTSGVHPGHTPYMNAGSWGKGVSADPKLYSGKGYPAWDKWPHGEALWRARCSYANNEFTPQQTMRGKMCLLGYLYSLGETHKIP
ncbi:MAG TPA: glycosyl hydrolase family 5 [Lentisphaeria bacterium]|nr:glycosyl hydrolase family 5 [Lentisphaeria bacterium]